MDTTSRYRREKTLVAQARGCPLAPGVYRLFCGRELVHVGMAGGAATLRSEVMAHARGHYGAATQRADRVEWEVARDSFFAYRRFLSLYTAATYAASGPHSRRTAAPSRSRRYSAVALRVVP